MVFLNISNKTFDNLDTDRAVLIDLADEGLAVANYLPSASVMDSVPPEVPSVVPLLTLFPGVGY